MKLALESLGGNWKLRKGLGSGEVSLYVSVFQVFH